MKKFFNWTKESCTIVSTTVTLGGAPSGCQQIPASADGCELILELEEAGSTRKMTFVGTYTDTGRTVSVDKILAVLGGGTTMPSWGAGALTVRNGPAADMFNGASETLTLGTGTAGTMTVPDLPLTLDAYQIISTGVNGKWAFSEGTGSTAADTSGNSHDLALSNVSWGTSPTSGSFNGSSSKGVLSSSTILTGPGAFAVALRFLSSGGWQGATLVSKTSGNGSVGWYVNVRSDGRIEACQDNYSMYSESWYSNASLWNDLVYVYDGKLSTIYLNNQTKRYPLPAYSSVSNPLCVGACDNGSGGFNRWFNGNIRDVCFWTRAISQDEALAWSAGTPVAGGSLLKRPAGLIPSVNGTTATLVNATGADGVFRFDARPLN